MELEAVIGLELHIQMKTKSKLFSAAPTTFGAPANTNVAPFDIAFPGVMPVVNKQAVINAIRTANALNMYIEDTLIFDRKNYFYSDLPKGYQITQEFKPLGIGGWITIKGEKEKKIRVTRLHIEEDTCKQVHYDDYSLLDYNRAGIPLIEIVTYPDFENGKEAALFVEKIRSIVTYLDVSDGKMEEGSLRCDINISLKEKNSLNYGTKVEIKNLNSITNIQKAIEYEVERQTKAILEGKKVLQETRRYDEKSKKTVLMRKKIDAIDYKCFTESNIPPIRLTEEFINEAISSSPELAEQKVARYIANGLDEKSANMLVADKDTSIYYDELLCSGVNPKLASNWVLMDVQSYLNKENMLIKDFPISSSRLAELIKMVESGLLSNKQAREIFTKMMKTGEEPHKLITELGITQINDEDVLMKIVNKVLDDNPNLVDEYKKGRSRVLGFLVGQVISLTNGKANPSLTSKLLNEELKRR